MELQEFDRGTEFDQGEGNFIRVSEEFELSEFELRWQFVSICQLPNYGKRKVASYKQLKLGK